MAELLVLVDDFAAVRGIAAALLRSVALVKPSSLAA